MLYPEGMWEIKQNVAGRRSFPYSYILMPTYASFTFIMHYAIVLIMRPYANIPMHSPVACFITTPLDTWHYYSTPHCHIHWWSTRYIVCNIGLWLWLSRDFTYLIRNLFYFMYTSITYCCILLLFERLLCLRCRPVIPRPPFRTRNAMSPRYLHWANDELLRFFGGTL